MAFILLCIDEDVFLVLLTVLLQVYVINATNLQSGIQRFCKRVSGVQYFLEHHHGFFYVLTNSHNVGEETPSSGEYYLARCPVENLQSTCLQVCILPSNIDSRRC